LAEPKRSSMCHYSRRLTKSSVLAYTMTCDTGDRAGGTRLRRRLRPQAESDGHGDLRRRTQEQE
jgi:hypothetical protein